MVWTWYKPSTWFVEEQDNSGLVLRCADEYCLKIEIEDREVVYIEKYSELYHVGECTHTGLEKLEKDGVEARMKELSWVNMQKARKMVREGKIIRECYAFAE